MQIAGEKCICCQKRVAVGREGSWCIHCGAIFHRNCISYGSPCPGCNRPLESPLRRAVYSRNCFVCGHSTSGDEFCATCGSVVRWDTEDDYRKVRADVHRTAVWQLLSGVGQMALGLALLALVIPSLYLLWISLVTILLVPLCALLVLALPSFASWLLVEGLQKARWSIPRLRMM